MAPQTGGPACADDHGSEPCRLTCPAGGGRVWRHGRLAILGVATLPWTTTCPRQDSTVRDVTFQDVLLYSAIGRGELRKTRGPVGLTDSNPTMRAPRRSLEHQTPNLVLDPAEGTR
jgi:hypothetical protein